MNLGYDKALYLLPFDHRQSYVKDMFHLEPPLTGLQRDQIIDAALATEFGNPVARRVEAPATVQQKKQLAALTQQITSTELAGERIETVCSRAPGNGEPIGGIKVKTANGWFAARPSGTENIYKIYAESFKGDEHLPRIQQEAQAIVDAAISPSSST